MLYSVKISSPEKTFDLVLIQWYDYKNNKKSDKYRCLWLILITQYKFIPIESGVKPVYIIPRFIKNNEYFVNTFMF